MTLLGNLALWLAVLVGVWGALAGFVGGLKDRPDLARSARHAVFAMCGALLVAVVSLEWALFQHDFNVEYVAAYTSRNLPIFYTWSALYAGQKGSLLFWATVLSLFGSLALVLTPRHHRALLPHVAGVVSLVAAFFISVMLFGHANPFQRLPYTPLDGNGLNPQLQNPGMVFHPPMLYLGYISITIPFAFAIAALLSRRLDTDWLVAIRKWTLLSWLFLGVGPGRERIAPAVAHDDRVPPLRDDPGKAWHAEEVEPGPDHRVVAPVDLRHLHHALRRDLERPLVHPVERRILLSRVPDRDGDRELRAVREPAAAARSRSAARVDGEPRGELPVQQPAVSRDCVLRAVGHPVPDPLRARPGNQGHRRSAVLQPGEHPARPRAARAHGHRAADRLAPGLGAEPTAPVRGPGHRRRVHRVDPAGGGNAGLLRPHGDRARRVRRGDRGAGVRPRRARPAPPVRGGLRTGARPVDRPQPQAVRWLHRAHRHRHPVRRVRRHGVQDRDRGQPAARRVRLDQEPVRLDLPAHPPRDLAVRRPQPAGDRCDARGQPRRQAARRTHDGEAPARGRARSAVVPAVQRGRHPERSARGPVRRPRRRGERHRAGGVPVHHQPARVVGVVWRDDRRARRADRDVAGRRASGEAGAGRILGALGRG